MTDTAPQTPTPAPLKTLKIDFVSDVVCPWCVVGLGGLETALETLKAEGVAADIAFQPFELIPQIAPQGENSRIWNTFDAHRLLHWAHETAPDRQKALKQALFTAHFTDNRNLTDAGVLTAAAEAAGLDRNAAAEVLASGRYAQAVRSAQETWRSRGINSVPAVVVEGKYLISGGQPAAAFEQALRQIAAEV